MNNYRLIIEDLFDYSISIKTIALDPAKAEILETGVKNKTVYRHFKNGIKHTFVIKSINQLNY